MKKTNEYHMLRRDPEKRPKRIIRPNKTHEKDKRAFYVQTRPRKETTTDSTENATPPESTTSGNFRYFLGEKKNQITPQSPSSVTWLKVTHVKGKRD